MISGTFNIRIGYLTFNPILGSLFFTFYIGSYFFFEAGVSTELRNESSAQHTGIRIGLIARVKNDKNSFSTAR